MKPGTFRIALVIVVVAVVAMGVALGKYAWVTMDKELAVASLGTLGTLAGGVVGFYFGRNGSVPK